MKWITDELAIQMQSRLRDLSLLCLNMGLNLKVKSDSTVWRNNHLLHGLPLSCFTEVRLPDALLTCQHGWAKVSNAVLPRVLCQVICAKKNFAKILEKKTNLQQTSSSLFAGWPQPPSGALLLPWRTCWMISHPLASQSVLGKTQSRVECCAGAMVISFLKLEGFFLQLRGANSSSWKINCSLYQTWNSEQSSRKSSQRQYFYGKQLQKGHRKKVWAGPAT